MDNYEWTTLFDEDTLAKGMTYYQQGKAKNLVEEPDSFEVTVRGSRNYKVKIITHMEGDHDIIQDMKCTCEAGQEGKICKHKAAALYLISDEYIVWAADPDGRSERKQSPVAYAGNDISKNMNRLLKERHDELAEQSREETGQRSAEKQQYFQYQNFHKGLGISQSVLADARKVVEKGRLKNMTAQFFYGGYTIQDQDTLYGKSEIYYERDFPSCSIVYDRNEVVSAACSRMECKYGRKWNNKLRLGYVPCEHVAALVLQTQAYLKEHNPGDYTSGYGMKLLNELREGSLQQVTSAADLKGEMLKLEPSVKLSANYAPIVSFRVGASRLYKVKKFGELLENTQAHNKMKFGKSTLLQMGEEFFDDSSRKWYRFIESVMQAERRRGSQLNAMYGRSYYYEASYGLEYTSDIPLFGIYLDMFYDSMGEESVTFEKTQTYDTETMRLTAQEGQLKTQLSIHKNIDPKTKEFTGIKLTGSMPEMIQGQNYSYYMDDEHIYRVDGEMSRRLEPLTGISKDGEIDVVIGRNYLSDFYHKSLPYLKQLVEVVEYDQDVIDQYLPPKPEFICYFDLDEDVVLCRAEAVYGSKIHSLFDRLENDEGRALEVYRDSEEEWRVLDTLLPYLNQYDSSLRLLFNQKSEERVFEFLTDGINALLELCEVQVTDRFKKLQIHNSFKVSVGVSVKSNLMDLSIHSDDLSDEELLDILMSYRAKKRYYRLKNGDFIDFDDNDTVEQLSYMMETMRIPLKQFVSGKMELPAYRALYLDKMLEQTEGVYADRDQHFKRLIKEFKAVEDSDFEIPPTLKKVLRKYQKIGYRWLRTLDQYGFGGILADEMGLGKTLQVIAVLLAHHNEHPGEQHTSLIVCPASLVYNWDEELRRFAPELKRLLIVGTKAERNELIENCGEADVVVTSYDLLKRDIDCYEGRQFRFEVIDEAQMIKNQNTAAAKAVKLIKSTTKFALTGTPIENRLSELWSIFDYLMQGFLFDYQSFKQNMETPIVKRQDEEVKNQLQRMVAPFILRRKKQAVLKDLPEKLEEIRYAGMSSKQRKLYDGQVVKLKQLLKRQSDDDFNKNRIQVLAELTRIRQICCDPSLLYEDYNGESAKKESLMELIDGVIEGEHKALIFSQFTSMFDLIEKELNAREIAYYKITGSTPKEKRVELVKAFNKDTVPVFLISLKAGGTGLNLTGADVVIHYDPWWNVAVQNQATDRAHRIGQTKVVTVYKLIMKDTIEEKIIEMQQTKQKLAEDILGGEAVGSAQISREELLSLLG